MYKNKLFVLCEDLSAWEWNALEKFILSPYFNENQYLTQFFVYLKGQYKTGNPALSKEAIFRHVYPKLSYNDAKTRHLMSDLSEKIEAFLLVQRLRKDKFDYKKQLLKVYEERNLKKQFNQTLQVVQKIIDDSTMEDSEQYFCRFQQFQTRYMFLVASERREVSGSLQEAVDNLDVFYLANKLKLCCAMLNSQNILDVEHDIVLYEEILAYLDKSPLEKAPVLAIYYEILKGISVGEERHYEKLHELLAIYWEKFPRSEAHDMHVYLLNFGIRKINQGRSDFLRKTLQVFQVMIERNILIRDQYLSPWTFKNIVVLGLRLEEAAWVAGFIEQYKDKIAEEYRENAYTYNFAKYNFYAGNFDVVLDLLQKVTYDDIFYSLDSKAMLLKTYYELGETEVLYSLMDSFRIFLRRKRGISAKHRQNFSNLIKFTRKASRILPQERKKAERLLAEIKQTENVADVAWLLAKVEGLLKAV